MTRNHEMKWWGWGDKSKVADLDKYPGVYSYLDLHFKIKNKITHKEIPFPKMQESRVSQQMLDKLKLEFSELEFSIENEIRLTHSLGKAYRDLLQVRSGKIESSTDIVFFPKNEKQIARIFKWCLDNKFALVPFGGGTSVVGGLDAKKNETQVGVATVDLCHFKKIISINTESCYAVVEAGIFGPELEQNLAAQGYTLGHFPQSFEFSTLGGWAATRSSGQNSFGHGGIDEMILSLRLLTPQGVVENLNVPREAAGPSLKEIILGSEGLFGIISQVTVKIFPLAKNNFFSMYAFSNFSQAIIAGKMLRQQNIKLSILRISDEEETEGFVAMAKKTTGSLKEILAKKYLHFKGIDLDNFSTVLIGIEGGPQEIDDTNKKVKRIFNQFKCFELGKKAGNKWAKDRFFLPYLRDPFMDLGLVVDTFETATNWDEILPLHTKVKNSLMEVAKRQNVHCKIYCHLSHFYQTGASLYFTILANQDRDDPYKQWLEFKNKANEIIHQAKCAISHHHGIGVDHKKHLYHHSLHQGFYQRLKSECDPDHLLNPGKLL